MSRVWCVALCASVTLHGTRGRIGSNSSSRRCLGRHRRHRKSVRGVLCSENADLTARVVGLLIAIPFKSEEEIEQVRRALVNVFLAASSRKVRRGCCTLPGRCDSSLTDTCTWTVYALQETHAPILSTFQALVSPRTPHAFDVLSSALEVFVMLCLHGSQHPNADIHRALFRGLRGCSDPTQQQRKAQQPGSSRTVREAAWCCFTHSGDLMATSRVTSKEPASTTAQNEAPQKVWASRASKVPAGVINLASAVAGQSRSDSSLLRLGAGCVLEVVIRCYGVDIMEAVPNCETYAACPSVSGRLAGAHLRRACRCE